jgi:hypothetical protein
MKYFEKIAVGPKIRTYSKLIKDIPSLAGEKGLEVPWYASAYYSPLTGIVLKDSIKTGRKRAIVRHELTHWIRNKKRVTSRKRGFIDTLVEESAAHYGMQPKTRNKNLRNAIGGIKGLNQALLEHPKVGIPVAGGILGAEYLALKPVENKKK